MDMMQCAKAAINQLVNIPFQRQIGDIYTDHKCKMFVCVVEIPIEIIELNT